MGRTLVRSVLPESGSASRRGLPLVRPGRELLGRLGANLVLSEIGLFGRSGRDVLSPASGAEYRPSSWLLMIVANGVGYAVPMGEWLIGQS